MGEGDLTELSEVGGLRGNPCTLQVQVVVVHHDGMLMVRRGRRRMSAGYVQSLSKGMLIWLSLFLVVLVLWEGEGIDGNEEGRGWMVRRELLMPP